MSLAKDSEKLIKADYQNCKQVFINCSKLEDAAVEFMISCYTSLAGVKANVKKLLQVQDATTKLKTNQESLVNSSTSGRRVKRGKNEEAVTCATYITQVTTFENVCIIIT